MVLCTRKQKQYITFQKDKTCERAYPQTFSSIEKFLTTTNEKAYSKTVSLLFYTIVWVHEFSTVTKWCPKMLLNMYKIPSAREMPALFTP
jgi:SOS-response transcriptional repressor LexA